MSRSVYSGPFNKATRRSVVSSLGPRASGPLIGRYVVDVGGALTGTSDPAVQCARVWAAFAYDRWSGRDTVPPSDQPPAAALRRLGLSGLVFRALRDCDDSRASEFRDDYRHASTSNLIRLSQAQAFCQTLERKGITPVLIKGASFLARFPDDLGIRAMSDVDVLVDVRDFEQAEQALVADGYRPHGDMGERVRRCAPSVDFIRDAGPSEVEIDLHRGIAQSPLLPDLPAATLATHQRIGVWRVPAPPEAFCITAAHRARHGFVWWGLDLVDLKQLADASDAAAWDAIVRAARHHRVAGAAYAAFRQAIWWMGEQPGDAARLSQLARAVSPPVRSVLDRVARPASVLHASSLWARPLVRSLFVYPCATGSVWRSVAAAAIHLPRRAVDDWSRTQGAGLPTRLSHIVRLAVRGSHPPTRRPGADSMHAPDIQQVSRG